MREIIFRSGFLLDFNGRPAISQGARLGAELLEFVGLDLVSGTDGCDCPACPCHRQDEKSREKFARMQREGWRWRYDAWTRTHTLEAPQPRPGGRGFINCSWHGPLEVEYGTYECPRCAPRRALQAEAPPHISARAVHSRPPLRLLRRCRLIDFVRRALEGRQ